MVITNYSIICNWELERIKDLSQKANMYIEIIVIKCIYVKEVQWLHLQYQIKLLLLAKQN